MNAVGNDLARALRLLAMDAENQMICEATIISLDKDNKLRKICLSSSDDSYGEAVLLTGLRALS